MELPGFYYDPVKKKYFKILQHHQAGTSQQYNDTSVRHAREKKSLLKMAEELNERSKQWSLVRVLNQRSVGLLKRHPNKTTYTAYRWNEDPVLECCLFGNEAAFLTYGQSQYLDAGQVFTLNHTIDDRTHPASTLPCDQYHFAIYPSQRNPLGGRDEHRMTITYRNIRSYIVPFSPSACYGERCGFTYCVNFGYSKSRVLVDSRSEIPASILQMDQNIYSVKVDPYQTRLMLLMDHKISYFDGNLHSYSLCISGRKHGIAQDIACAAMSSVYVAYKSGKIAHVDDRNHSPLVQFQLKDGHLNQSIVSMEYIKNLQTIMFNTYNGKIHLYDVRMRKILNSVSSWTADCSRQKLKLDSSHNYAILGSDSGICSVYNTSTLNLVSLINSTNSDAHDFTNINRENSRSLSYDIEIVDGLPRVLIANSSTEEAVAEVGLYRSTWYV